MYPCISEKLLKEALDFADKHHSISPLDKKIILHSKMSLLYESDTPWVKRNNEKNFDVAMGAYDGAEACEIVVCFLLAKLTKKLGANVSVGCYRDDGLAVCHGSPREIENHKKAICKVFEENGLKITIEANKKIIDYLDITMDLTNNTYKPFMKPGNRPLYIHKLSNHPPAVIKAVPNGINKRLTEISSNENEFLKAKPVYQEALTNSGFTHTLKYDKQDTQNKKPSKRKRTRNILWFNPPFNIQVKTNIGAEFIKLLNECFPIGSALRSVFNKNNVKLSYSCLPSIQAKLNAHNNKLKNPPKEQKPSCNCKKNRICPLDKNCEQQKNVVYQATVTSDKPGNKRKGMIHTYIGLASDMKLRIANHEQTFRKKDLRNTTELSKHIWDLSDEKIGYAIKWRILGKATPYSNVTKRCNLCLLEKWYIICKKDMASLNKKNELVSRCPHASKFLIRNASLDKN